MDVQDPRFWIALRLIDDLGSVSCRRLLDHFGSPRNILEAPEKELLRIPRLSRKAARNIRAFSDWGRVDEEIRRAEAGNVSILPMNHPAYPKRLLQIYDPPPLLYVKGEWTEPEGAVAVIGSRRATPYGRFMTERIARDLSYHGITIVSGMARGIDTAAHWGTLRAKGKTIAVLGSGMDVVYPPENADLFERIPERGAVLTEFPFGTPPQGINFPLRNRIISGLSLGVVVVEAGEKSGSLITARIALEQGKEVFAIPGSIDSPGSRGTHRLIRQGAKLVESVQDILEEILPQIPVNESKEHPPEEKHRVSPPSGKKNPEPYGEETLNESEEALLRLLGRHPLPVDRIIQASGFDTREVLSLLLSLEIKGQVERLPGKQFRLKEHA